MHSSFNIPLQANKKAKRNGEEAKKNAYASILKEHMRSSSQKNEAARAAQACVLKYLLMP